MRSLYKLDGHLEAKHRARHDPSPHLQLDSLPTDNRLDCGAGERSLWAGTASFWTVFTPLMVSQAASVLILRVSPVAC